MDALKGKGKGKLQREADIQESTLKTKLTRPQHILGIESSGLKESCYSKETQQTTRSETPTPSASQPSPSQPSVPKLLIPPPSFNTAALKVSDQVVFDTEFAKRQFCPIVYIDLSKLEKDSHLDLYPYLEQCKSWLRLRISYNPIVVKHFYCNTKLVNNSDSQGRVIEERIETSFREQKILLSGDLINMILALEDIPQNSPKVFHIHELRDF